MIDGDHPGGPRTCGTRPFRAEPPSESNASKFLGRLMQLRNPGLWRKRKEPRRKKARAQVVKTEALTRTNSPWKPSLTPLTNHTVSGCAKDKSPNLSHEHGSNLWKWTHSALERVWHPIPRINILLHTPATPVDDGGRFESGPLKARGRSSASSKCWVRHIQIHRLLRAVSLLEWRLLAAGVNLPRRGRYAAEIALPGREAYPTMNSAC